jgi:hypothetical protein
MVSYLQYRRRVVNPADGQTYLIARRRPFAGLPPQSGKTAVVTEFAAYGDSRPPVGGGGPPSRDTLVFDTYVPDNTTAGIYTPIEELTNYNSPTTDSFTITTGNQVIENKIIYGRVTRGASNVVFRNCLFRGPLTTPSGETAIVNCNDTTYKGWELWDCTIAPQWPNANIDGIKSNNYKAMRCHIFWTTDGCGVFSNSASPVNGGTSVEIAGCLIEALCYWPGALYAYYNGPTYLLTSGSYAAYNSANDSAYVKRATQQPADRRDTGHNDGNHNDCIQVQGAFGRMVRNGVTGKWSGDGVYIHGNNLAGGDAVDNTGHGWDPSGLGIEVPGETGSLAGSRLGYGDNPSRRTTGQSPTQTRPVVDGDKRLPSGLYCIHGSGVIVQQNVNQFPYPSTAAPNDFSVVGQFNYIDNYGIGMQTQQGSYSSIGVAWLYNTFSPNVHRYSTNDPATCSIYPERIYNKTTTTFATALGGGDGLTTNLWDDPTNIYGRDGLPLTNLPLQANGSDNPRGGLRYG